MDIDEKRVKIYEFSYLLSLLLLLASAGIWFRTWAWAVLGCAIAILLLSLLIGRQRVGASSVGIAIAAASCVGLCVPILSATDGLSLPMASILPALPVAPMVLFALMGSRLLVASNDLSFRRFWRHPDLSSGSAHRQSVAAALLLGFGLWLTVIWTFTHLHLAGGDPSLAIVYSAVTGGTLIHYAILILFFTIMAWLADAMLLQLADRLTARRLIEAIGTPDEQVELTREAHRGVAHVIAETLWLERGLPGMQADTRLEAFRGFETASRRYIRGLLPVLPLLGFLGTVIGLARAMAELPAALGNGSGVAVDLTGTLSGLAIKFETTLLGLLASMIAAVLLNLLEKREIELASQCALAAARKAQLPIQAP